MVNEKSAILIGCVNRDIKLTKIESGFYSFNLSGNWMLQDEYGNELYEYKIQNDKIYTLINNDIVSESDLLQIGNILIFGNNRYPTILRVDKYMTDSMDVCKPIPRSDSSGNCIKIPFFIKRI